VVLTVAGTIRARLSPEAVNIVASLSVVNSRGEAHGSAPLN